MSHRHLSYVDREPASLPDPEVARLRSEIELANQRCEALVVAHRASEREGDEFRQRLIRERDRLLDVERGQAAALVLDAIDELDLCLKNADDSALAQGVRLIRNGLVKNVEASGVQRIPLEGTEYDPRLAEAVDLVGVADPAEDGRVIAVARAAYARGGSVFRPGRVSVGRYVQRSRFG